MSEQAQSPLRLFIAVIMPEEIKAEVERAQTELRRALTDCHITWTKREQFHLTLKFLEQVGASRTVGLSEKIRAVCRSFAALRLRAEGIGTFPTRGAPRVVWVGVLDQQNALSQLQRSVADATRDFAPEEPEKEFTGHVTLGRVKAMNRLQAEIFANLISGMADRFFGKWTADRIAIMRSELLPGGARHTCLASIPLGDCS